MNKYKIPCNFDQVRKAFELGAAIDFIPGSNPDAEEMIGWLEDKGFEFETGKYAASVSYNKQFLGMYSGTRKETTLKAIDAALEYLLK